MKAFQDLTGRTVESLTVVRLDHKVGAGAPMHKRGGYWECLCRCGSTVIVHGKGLRNGKTRSCGCLAQAGRQAYHLAKAGDLTGQKFGRLTVTGLHSRHAYSSGSARTVWACVCVCGAEATIPRSALTTGNTKSCGCLIRDTNGGRNRTHGQSKTPEYKSWTQMRHRCNNEQSDDFAHYGGRGVKVCAAWDASFEQFLKDMGPKPSPKHSIDRIDNTRGYEPGNCRWATRTQQARNRRTARLVTHDGLTLALSEWAERLGVPYARLQSRLDRGMSPEQALTPQLYQRKKPKRTIELRSQV